MRRNRTVYRVRRKIPANRRSRRGNSMKTKPLDLTQFCTPDSIHFSFDRPWRDGSHVYASDGKILVCVDAVLLPDWTPPVGQVPQGLDLLLAPVSKIRKWRRLAPVADCAACNNTGRV